MEATATALEEHTETAPAAPEAPVLSAEESEDAALDAAWDKAHASDEPESDEPESDEPEKAEAKASKEEPEAEEDDASDDTVAKVVDTPSDLPPGLKEAWKDIPESARAAVLESQRDMGRRMSAMGRQVQGIAPIRDVLQKAVAEMPHLAAMKPETAAEAIFDLAKVSAQFNSAPVETMMGLIQKHGMGEHIKAALNGQQAPQGGANTVALQNHIKELERQVAEARNPDYLKMQFESFNNENSLVQTVQSFAQNAKYWGVLEPHLEPIIKDVMGSMPDGTSAEDVLGQAYEIALKKYLPDVKASGSSGSEKDIHAPDPAKTEAALKAKSVNITSRSSGKPRPMTEDEMLDAAWERAQKRT